MPDFPLVPAVATLIAGALAATVSLVASILAKDQKTSEFRQSWIEGLRDDVSQLIAHHEVSWHMSEIVRKKSKEEVQKYILEHQKEWVEIYMLESRIRLRLNPNEHQGIIGLLDEDSSDIKSKAEHKDFIRMLSAETQKVLKNEWDRVKLGESSIIWLRRVSKAFIISSLIAAIITAGYHSCPELSCLSSL
ncbi:hypothetical protein CCL16_11775 [Pseudomonas syringae]|uniref:hypothetical protein n=1 Tax=Pseudomonas TaxID=286 RepID=UPI0007319D9A|nr:MULTISPECIES: hypothetical protein [Pseudomonas]KTB91325.1 hypothetical protein AO072_21285 [Pseudomonas syringae ICMP 13102]KTB91930.1 hypothetical protein AO069_12180 [Pseudomonas syringae pv. syringae PD2774]PBP87950.1 hypothetical protein CCL16_11775 [Pseudomonas syringae]